MGTPIRVLIVEDSEEDTFLIIRELKRGGFDPIHERVETAEGMKAALSTKTWDLILADYSMPHFSGLEALKLSKESGLDLPFIIVSGSIGEDVAVEAMKSGAHDYLMKNNLARLVPAIQQELREAEVRRKLKESQNALQESEKRYRQVVESATEIIYTVDEKGNFTYGNPAGLKITGYSLQELRGLNYTDLVVPDHRERVSQAYINQFRERRPTSYMEFPFFNKSGEIIWFSQNTSLVIEDGKVVEFHIIARDITERKQAEEALQESEEKYRLLVENANEAIFVIQDGMLRFFNIKYIELIGYSKEELTSTPFINFVHPDDREVTLGRYLKRIRGEELSGVNVFRIIDKAGNIRWAEVHSVLISWEGRPATLNFLNDITERQRTEQSLFDSEQRYRNLVENAPDVIFTLSPDGTITSLNPAFETITGWSRSEWLGKVFTAILRPDDLSRGLEFFRSVLKGEKTAPFELGVLEESGDYLTAEFTITPQTQDGSVMGVLGIARDITDRKRAEQEMSSLQDQFRQSQKMEAIGRLTGGMAHDFNNLLTIIQGYSELSLVEMDKGSSLRGNIEEIEKATDRATDLIRQLLAFSRCQIMEMKVLDLNALLRNLHKMLSRIIGEDIELMMVLGENLGRVKTDPGQIEQVIMNLAVNARDAMPKGGRFTIETANVNLNKGYARNHVTVPPGPYVMISVSDTGMGMTPEVRDRVFEPFFTTKEKGKGTGLGLSTVYGIIKQSGGHIWVSSEPGKGTEFKIYLPRVDEPLEELKEKVEKEGVPRGNERILIVEDEEYLLKLAGRILERQGYTVLQTSSTSEALEICKEQKKPIHLILTDVVMPKMSGLELIEQCRQMRADFKTLYMSGYTDDIITHQGILQEGLDYIQKPFTVDELSRKVRRVLDK